MKELENYNTGFDAMNKKIAFLLADRVAVSGEYSVVNGAVATSSLLSIYRLLQKEKIAPLEDLPALDKERYWATAKLYFNEKAACINACRCMYVLDLIINSKTSQV